MATICAFCRKPGELSREHLYPKFLYRENGKRFLGFNEAAGKVTVGERVINDVCKDCNNGPLSELDDYGAEYYKLNRLDQTHIESRVVTVSYDYDRLLRWVLKVSYNSFRTVPSIDDPFASLAPYILTGVRPPKPRFVKLFIEIIRDHKLSGEECSAMEPSIRESGYLPCRILRSGRIEFPFQEGTAHYRHFQVNSHLFTLLILPYRTKPAESSRRALLLLKKYPDTKVVDPTVATIEVPVSRRDSVNINTDDIHPKEMTREAEYLRDRGRH